MSAHRIESVQLYRCTDEFTGKDYHLSPQTPNNPFQANHYDRSSHFARLADRTVYPLRETRMQMCRFRRSWPQILSVGQLSRPQAGTGVCCAKISRPSKRVSHQLSDGKAITRRDFQHQSRIVAPERHVVKPPNGYFAGALHVNRDHGFRNHRGEYALHDGQRIADGDRRTGGKR